MTLACQFQHLLAEPVNINCGTYRERTDSPLAGFVRGTTPEVPPNLPVPVLAEPYHIEDACKRLNRMTDGEARASTIEGSRNDRATLAAGNSLSWASVQLAETDYLQTIIDAIECADGPDDFRLIRAAINKVGGVVNRASLRTMAELREKEVAI